MKKAAKTKTTKQKPPAAKPVKVVKVAAPPLTNTRAAGVVRALRTTYGEDAAMLLGSKPRNIAVCPTGIAVLDNWVLGIGGFPLGRVVEVFGPPSSCKTTIANKILASVQRMGGVGVLAETEQSYDLDWAKRHGVNVDDLVFLQPNYLDGEGGFFQEICTMAEKSSAEHPIVIVLDSVAASSTKREYDEGIVGEAAVAETARAWSTGLRKLNSVVAKSHVLLVLVNQTRTKIGVMFGNPEQTTGGTAIKFYSSLRISCFPGSKDKEGAYQDFHIRADKNKLCPPFRKSVVRLNFQEGFDDRWTTINYAKDMGCLSKSTHVSNKAWEEACIALDWASPTLDTTATPPAEEPTPTETTHDEERT